MNTHETYVSLETAKQLKEAGFDWECIRYYQNDEETLYGPLVEQFKLISTNFNVAPIYMDQYSAPTLVVAQRWLREVKGYILEITAVRKNPDDVYKTYIEYWYNIFEKGKCGHYDTYEQAQEAGIKKALELILEKGE